jgi:EmrB/QacA subfamily drug resistance transporter
MTDDDRPIEGEAAPGASDASSLTGSSMRLGILLAMAMFVLVVDTSLMNVSISAVVEDVGTTVSGVQSAIALEALVSAAFILISSKLGDLFGRKRAYILGLLGYAIGATAMTLTQDLRSIIIFWAILGGLGASLLLPAMQSLIHGNFEGGAQRRVYALVGAAAAIAAAIGPLVGGFITTFLSWRVGFALEVVVIAIVLLNIRLVRDVPYTGERGIDLVGAVFSVIGMGGIVLGILVWQEGGEAVGAMIAIGAVSMALLAWWLRRRKREGALPLIDPDLFRARAFRLGISGQALQQIALGGLMISLPIFLQMVLEYSALLAGLSLAPLSLTMFFVALIAGRRAGDRRPSTIIRVGFLLLVVGVAIMLPIVPRADSGWWLAIPLAIAGAGLGLLVSQLNNYTLAPISEERISEAAGVNSAAGSFGLSFGLAMAGGVMLATLALTFTNMVQSSTVIPPDDQEHVATVLEEDAQIMSNTQLDALLADEPEDVQAEIIRINTEARPISLQVALLVPLIAGLLGLVTSFRMVRLGDTKPAASLEGVGFG